MDRVIVQPGEIPLDADILNDSKNAFLGLGKLAGIVLGTGVSLNGLTCTPTSPASMQVEVAPGEIYSLQTVDTSAYGALGTDSHTVVKQGIALAKTTLSCPAPGTAGQSINYLVQVAFSETDGGSVVRDYYNASNPSVPWSGPGGGGAPDFTVRSDLCVVTVKAGTAAATGTQTTPAADAGNTGAYVVTVANGATTIISGNISAVGGAPFVTERLKDKISQATGDARYLQTSAAQTGAAIYAAASGSSSTFTAALSPVPAALTDGMVVHIKFPVTNDSAGPTLNLNSLGAKTIYGSDGVTQLPIAELPINCTLIYHTSGTRWVLMGAEATNAIRIGIDTSGSANSLNTLPTPAVLSNFHGLTILLQPLHDNTGACTLSTHGESGPPLKYNATDLIAGQLKQGRFYLVAYNADAGYFELLSPPSL